MKFYKYWAAGEAAVDDNEEGWPLRAYGGSNKSLEEAQSRALEAAKRAAAAFYRGDPKDAYGYSDRPAREEIIKEIHDATGLTAAITRNSYGSLVLNSSRVMFIDVDFARPATLGSILRAIWNGLRGSKPSVEATVRANEAILDRVVQIGHSLPELGYRVYRTAGGYRLLVTSDTYDPIAPESRKLLTAFGSDPLYMRLCKAQECFRARLSAKYWRCGASKPPSRFPWATEDEEQKYREWEENYHERANRFATCRLVGSYGKPIVCDSVREILETHDRLTLHEGAQLA